MVDEPQNQTSPKQCFCYKDSSIMIIYIYISNDGDFQATC